MKIIKNDKLIKRNNRIGSYSTLLGIGSIGVCAYYLIQPLRDPESTSSTRLTIWLVSLALGFIFSQIGMYMGNRWGGHPRPDEHLDSALKGLPGEFSIYHFSTPVPHLQIGRAHV